MPEKKKNSIYYGWIIVAAFLVVQVLLLGISSSFTVFFKPIETAFSLSRTTTSAISSVSWVLIPLTAFVGGWAVDRYGPKKVVFLMGLFTGLSLFLTSLTTHAWQLFLTYSVLLSMGFGAIYAVTASVVSRWFDKKRGLAVGIAGSGDGIGSVAMAPLSTWLISKYNWEPTYMILGIVTWVVVLPISFLIKREPREIGLLPDGIEPGAKSKTLDITREPVAADSTVRLKDILKTGTFWVVAGIWFFFSFCMLMLLTHMVPYVTDMGISAQHAAFIVGLLGGSRAVGMISFGGVADRFGRKRVAIVATLVQAGIIILLLNATNLSVLYLFAVIYGLGNGGLFSGITPLLGDTFGLSRLGTVLGMLEIGWGIGAAAGPLVGGFFYDTYGSYTGAFIIAAAAMLAVVVLVALIKPVRFNRKAEEQV